MVVIDAEVYLGKMDGNLFIDMLPFDEDRLPLHTKEASLWIL